MKKVLITAVTAIPGAVVSKGMTHSLRPGFVLPVSYTLADGSTIQSSVRTERKKDLQGSLERQQKSAAAGAMAAQFNDNGEFWGTVQTYGSLSEGLKPAPIPVSDVIPTAPVSLSGLLAASA